MLRSREGGPGTSRQDRGIGGLQPPAGEANVSTGAWATILFAHVVRGIRGSSRQRPWQANIVHGVIASPVRVNEASGRTDWQSPEAVGEGTNGELVPA